MNISHHMRRIDSDELRMHIKNINIHGFTIIKKYLEHELIQKLLVVVENFGSEKTNFKGRPDRDENDKMVYNLQNKNKLFIDILDTDIIIKIASEKLNDKYYRWLPKEEPNYILHYYNARSSGKKLDLHIDTYIPFLGYKTIAMQFAFALNSMDEKNGCTVVVPGSHLSGKYTDRNSQDKKSVCADPGDVIIWDSRLWHGTNENISGNDRWALIATFSQWWVKQAMDIPKALPDDIYISCTNRQKALLGFCSIPPKDEFERINTKTGYESLKNSTEDYK